MKAIDRAMKLAAWIALAAAGAVLAQEVEEESPPTGPEAPAWATSHSLQFRVTGGDGMMKGVVAMLAEQAKKELLTLTGEKDEWKVPVSIFLHGAEGDPVPGRPVVIDEITFNEGGYLLSIHAHLGRGIQRDLLKRTVVAALLYERALRGRPTDSEAPLLVSPWLVEGLLEATAWKEGESDRRLYDALFKRGGLFKLNDLFAVEAERYDDLDAATRAAFRVSSGALVMALLEQPQGKDGFRSFLTEAAAYEGETPNLLRKHFPELNLSETSLAKWWMLQLANSGAAPLTDILPVVETEKALNEALVLNFRREDGISQEAPIGRWEEVAKLKPEERVDAVKIAEESLVRLSYRCFPSYRPLLAEYQVVLASIARGKTEEVAKRLAELEENREVMLAKAKRGEDFLDWFEITRARETSGIFDDYLRLKDRLKANPRRRNDGISRYLDRVEEIFHREDQGNMTIWDR